MMILSIGSDRAAFNQGSPVRQRIIEYGKLVGETHYVIFAKKSLGLKQEKISENVWIYPTDSKSRFWYICDAMKLGKKILIDGGKKDWRLLARDPFETGFVAWRLKKKFGFPMLLQIHTDFLSPFFGRESLINKARVFFGKFLIVRADAIRVVSERIKKSLQAECLSLKAVPFVLPIFVEAQKIESAPIKIDLHQKYPQFDFIILMASRLTRGKNINLAIEAMAIITKKNSKTGLIIVGFGPEEKYLKRKIENFHPAGDHPQGEKLIKNIKMESWSDDLAPYYKTADLFLLTSNYEGYGLAPIEAAIAGATIVMTNVGCANEIIIDGINGLVVPIGDRVALVQAISKIMSEPALREKFRQNKIRVLEKLGTKDEYLKKYKNFLSYV